MSSRAQYLDRISVERARQSELPGSEFDHENTPNDFIAIAMSYLGEPVRTFHRTPSRDDFEDALVKAAAVILAALEHAPYLQAQGLLFGETSPDMENLVSTLALLDK